MPSIHNGGRNMSLDKKLNILLILTSLGYGLLLAVMIFGAIFPGEPSQIFGLWYVWSSILDMVAYVVSITVMHLVTKPKIIK